MGFLSSRRARLRAAFSAWQTKITNEKVAAEEKAARELQEAEDARELAAEQAATEKAQAEALAATELEQETIDKTNMYLSDINSIKTSINTSVSSISSKLTSIAGYSSALHSSATSESALNQYNHMVSATKELSALFTILVQQKSLLDTAKDGLEKSKGSYSSTATIYNNGISAYNLAVANYNTVKDSTGNANEMVSDGTAAMSSMKASEAKAEALEAAEKNLADFVDSAPTTLDTLNELAAALNDDPNFSATISSQIGTKLNSSAYTASDVLTKIKTVDGSGSGLDADKLGGIQGSQFLRSDTADTMTGSLTIDTGDQALWTVDNGTGNSWRGRIGHKNSTGDTSAFLGSHNSKAVVAAHNNALTAWDDLYVNTVDGSTGGYVRMPTNTYIAGQKAFHDGYHPNADKWTTARTLSLTGDVSGSVSWDGSGNASLSTTVGNDSHTHDGRYYTESESNSRFGGYTHSGSDFPSGTFVTTNIPATAVHGASFVIEVTGKSYTSLPPFSFIAQGYLYSNTIINTSGINNGDTRLTYIKVMENGGYLSFWWPRISYWNSFEVRVRDAGGSPDNRVTSIVNSSDPSGATKKVTINLSKSWASHNDGAGSGLDADTVDGMHASSFLADSGKSLSTNGYQKLSNGLIIQWGRSSASGGRTISFPIAFPNACLNVTASAYEYRVYRYGVATWSLSKTSFYAYLNSTASWHAIGY